jgi:hypothetical protein
MTPNQIIVFDLPNKNRLVLKVIDEDILSLDASICLSNEENIFKMTNNVIKYKKNDGIEVRRRTGKFQLILSGEALKMIPNWIINQHLLSGSDYFATSEYKLIDIEVIEPGLVKIQGIWMDQETAIVVSPTNLSFINKNAFGTMHLVGKGLQTVILSSAPALFAMAAQYTHKAKS